MDFINECEIAVIGIRPVVHLLFQRKETPVVVGAWLGGIR